MALISELKTLITADNSKFNVALQQSEASVSRFGNAVKGIGGILSGAIAGAGIAAFYKIANNIDSAADSARKLNIEFGQFQKLTYIAKQADSSIENVTSGMRKLVMTLNSPTKEVTDVLSSLGLGENALQGLSQDARYLKIISALSKVTDTTKQASDAAVLFGKSWSDQIPLVQANIEELGNRFDKLGIKISESQAESIAKWDETRKELETVFTGLSQILISDLAPFFTWAAGQLINISKGFKDLKEYASGSGQSTLDLIEGSNTYDTNSGTPTKQRIDELIAAKTTIPAWDAATSRFERSTETFQSSVSSIDSIFNNRLSQMERSAKSSQLDEQFNRIFGDVTKPKAYIPDAQFDQRLRDIYTAITAGDNPMRIQEMIAAARTTFTPADNASVNKALLDELYKRSQITPAQKPIQLQIDIKTAPGFYAEITKSGEFKAGVATSATDILVQAANASGG